MTTRAAPGGPDLEQQLARARLGDGLALFPDSTQMGLWTFASHLVGSLPYQQLVPIGPIADPARAVHPQAGDPAPGASRLLTVPRTQAALYGTS